MRESCFRALAKDTINGVLADAPFEDSARALLATVGRRFPTFSHEQLAFRAMRRLLGPGSYTIDIGANRGMFLEYIRTCAPFGVHYAIEPIPWLADQLKAEFPGVRVKNIAVGEERGQRPFFVHLNSLTTSGLAARREEVPGVKIKEISVPVWPLDQVIEPQDRAHIRLIKLDVEGAELPVLRGAQQLIKDSRPYVIFEHHRFGAPHFGATPQALHDLFESLGYEISLIGSWLRHQPGLDRSEFVSCFDHSLASDFLAVPLGT